MGGVGKTALATVVAHRMKDRYPDAQLFLNLRGADPEQRPPVTPAEAMQNVIHCFRPEAWLPGTVEGLTPIYRSVLAEAGRVLLLLDNAAGAEQVRPLLPPPNCLLLVTSRAQFQLPGLATRNLDCLQPAKSRELLLELAPRLDSHADKAAELCGNLPLALEVFAGAVNDKSLTPVPELLERFAQKQEKLAPVEAAFQVSYELLPEELRRCWRLLAVFPASFDLRAAAAVWADGPLTPTLSPDGQEGTRRAGEGVARARDALQSLVNASLVEWNEASNRLRLHDLVRQFCEEKLRSGGLASAADFAEPGKSGEAGSARQGAATEEEPARFRHARHYCDVGAEADKLYLQGGENILRGLELFDRERTHLEVAFEFLVSLLTRSSGSLSPIEGESREERAATLLTSLVDAVVYASDLRFHPHQSIRWQEGQLEAARTSKQRAAEGIAFGNLGNAYAVLGDARKAIEYYEKALVASRDVGDRRVEGTVLGNLGVAYKNSGDAVKGIEFYEQQLVIAREIGDRRGEGNALGNLGNAHKNLGDARKAIEFHEQQLFIAREIGDRRGEGNALGNLGIACSDLGDAVKAIEFYEQQLVITRKIGHRRGEGNALWNSADELWKLGDRSQAIRRGESALAIYEAIGDRNAARVRETLAQWRSAAS